MSEPRLVRGVVANAPSFINSLGRIKDANLQRSIVDALKGLLFSDIDQLPARLKFHQLSGKMVPSAVTPQTPVKAWSMHVTRDDAYKASFTFEGGVIYLRQVDTHALIDKRP